MLELTLLHPPLLLVAPTRQEIGLSSPSPLKEQGKLQAPHLEPSMLVLDLPPPQCYQKE